MTGRHPLSNGLCHTLPHESISHCSIRFMFPCMTKNGFVAVKQTKDGWNHRLRHHSWPRHCGLFALGRFEDAMFDQQLILNPSVTRSSATRAEGFKRKERQKWKQMHFASVLYRTDDKQTNKTSSFRKLHQRYLFARTKTGVSPSKCSKPQTMSFCSHHGRIFP